MQFRIELVAVADDGTECCQELVTLTRPEAKLEALGLTLAKTFVDASADADVAYQVGAPYEKLGVDNLWQTSLTSPCAISMRPRSSIGRVQTRNCWIGHGFLTRQRRRACCP